MKATLAASLAIFTLLAIHSAAAQDTGLEPARLPGIVVDDAAAVKEGTWTNSKHSRPYVGNGYIHSAGGAGQLVKFPVEINETAVYQVLVAYTPSGNRSQNAVVIVPTADGAKTFVLDQTTRPAGPYCFQPLGEMMLESGRLEIIISAERSEKGFVIADAVQVLTPEAFAAYKEDFEKNSPKLLAALKPDPNKPVVKAEDEKPAEEAQEPAPAFVRQLPKKPHASLTSEQLDALMEQYVGGIVTAPLVDDESFLRRVTLDLIGRQPTTEEMESWG